MGRRVTVIELPTALGAPPNEPRTAPELLRYSPGVQQLQTTTSITTTQIEMSQDYTAPVAGLSEMIKRTPSWPELSGVPVFFGGDHTASLASVNAITGAGETGLLWIDAHPDYNTRETSPSGNLHGMVLASLLGEGPRPEWQAQTLSETNIALVGVRRIDPGEMRRLRNSDISVYTMEDIRQDGLPTVLLDAWNVVTENTDHIHVSLDIDVFDPLLAPGVSTRVWNGLSAKEAKVLAEWIRRQDRTIDSMDVVELNPLMDQHKKTSDLAGRILQTMFVDG